MSIRSRSFGNRLLAIVAAGGLVLSASSAFSAAVRDFEMALRSAYGHYRAALFQSNQKDKVKTSEAISQFQSAWGKLMDVHRAAPPPHYVDDPAWGETIKAIEAVLQRAVGETEAGKLTEAHETLEAIRDHLAKLRARNGIVTFSDRMNAYHEHMEHLLQPSYLGFGAEGVVRVREDVAVLKYLAKDIAANPPTDAKGSAEYDKLLAQFMASVDAVSGAIEKADPPAINSARRALKKPYSQLFLKFG